jgi:hypothetical protein
MNDLGKAFLDRRSLKLPLHMAHCLFADACQAYTVCILGPGDLEGGIDPDGDGIAANFRGGPGNLNTAMSGNSAL